MIHDDSRDRIIFILAPVEHAKRSLVRQAQVVNAQGDSTLQIVFVLYA